MGVESLVLSEMLKAKANFHASLTLRYVGLGV